MNLSDLVSDLLNEKRLIEDNNPKAKVASIIECKQPRLPTNSRPTTVYIAMVDGKELTLINTKRRSLDEMKAEVIGRLDLNGLKE